MKRLLVHTDSMFVIDCFEKKWIHNWLSNGWIKADGINPVENRHEFRELLKAMGRDIDVKFVLEIQYKYKR